MTPRVPRKLRVGFITVNYFSAGEVAMMLDSLSLPDSECDFVVSVVDNSCDDDEWRLLNDSIAGYKSQFSKVILHRSESNGGFAAGNNAGYRCLAPLNVDVVILINPDVVLLEADFDEAVQEVLLNGNVVYGVKTLTAGRILSGLAFLSFATGKSRELVSGESRKKLGVIYPSGHFIAMRNDVWERCGGLSEDYFLFGEEADLVLILRHRIPGLRVASLGNVLVEHKGGVTTGTSRTLRAKSNLTFEQATRSSLILFRKHPQLRPWLPLVLLARLAFAVRVRAVVGPTAGKAILAGLKGGLSWRVSDNG